MTGELAVALLVNGAFFHMQSVMAYAVMGCAPAGPRTAAPLPTPAPRRWRAPQSHLAGEPIGRQHAQARAAHLARRPPSPARCRPRPAAPLTAPSRRRASILYFGNPMTIWSGGGTVLCIIGVLAYNHTRRLYPYRPPVVAPDAVSSPV